MIKDDERAGKRPDRVPLHKQKTLTSEDRPGYTRRWVNDAIGRIDAFTKAGWTLVSGDTEKTHAGLAQVESQLGSDIKRVVNKDANADCRHAVLMEIPTEWYVTDKLEQQKLIDEKEAAFDQSGVHRQTGMYGSMSMKNEMKAKD